MTPDRGDYYLHPSGEPTQTPGRWLSGADTLAELGIDGQEVNGKHFVALLEGRHPVTGRWIRPAGANGERGRRDRPHLQRPEVRLSHMGARRPCRTATHRGRPRQRRQTDRLASDRDGAHGAPPPGRQGDRAAGERSDRRRVPAHHGPRRARRRAPRSAAALASGHHRRRARRRSDRRSGVAAAVPRGPRARRLTTAQRSPTSSTTAATGSVPGRAATAATSRSPGFPKHCSTRSRHAAVK